jgi:ABC-type uncharacterized transport system permease subunit
MLKGLEGISMTHIYWLAIIVGMGSVFIMRLILSSKLGMGLAAIRDNDQAASSSGISLSFSVETLLKEAHPCQKEEGKIFRPPEWWTCVQP